MVMYQIGAAKTTELSDYCCKKGSIVKQKNTLCNGKMAMVAFQYNTPRFQIIPEKN